MTDSLMRNLNMQAIANLPIWLNMAAQVYAPSKVVLVGAGNGTGPLVLSLLGLKVSPLHANMHAHLIEADPLVLSQLAKKLDLESAWTISQEVVVPDQSSIDTNLNTYYQYSLGTESSLLPPGSLKDLWPNIQLRDKESCANGILLSSLLPTSWLMIDCLPAAQLIQGVNLDQVDVLIARVVFDEIEKSPLGSSLFELDEKLSSQGFKLYACFTERNTSLGKALWFRDSAKQSEQSKAHGEQQAKQLSQQKSEIQQLTELKADLESKLEAEVKSRVQEVQSLRLERDALEQDKARAQEKLDAEINSKNALQAKIQELEQQQVEFSAKKLEFEKFAEQTTQQVKELQDKLEKIDNKSQNLILEKKYSKKIVAYSLKFIFENYQLNIEAYRKINKYYSKSFDAKIFSFKLFILRELFNQNILTKENLEEIIVNFINESSILTERKECELFTILKIVFESDILVIAHIKNDYIPTKIATDKNYYERPFLDFLGEFIQQKGVIIDVGANIGNHSIYFAKKTNRKIISFEPEPLNYICLIANIELNEIASPVCVYETALGKCNEKVLLKMAIKNNRGSFTAKKDIKGKYNYENEEPIIEVTTLDNVMKNNHKDDFVALIKIDVEGMELDVLMGSLEIIKANKPIIACECSTDNQLSLVENFLIPLGYQNIQAMNSTATFIFINIDNNYHRQSLYTYLRQNALKFAISRDGFS